MALRRYFGKISPLQIGNLVGHNGELVIDETTDKIYIMDGVTPGGHEIANVSANLNLEFTNVSPALDSAYTLGTSAFKWNNLWVNESNFLGNLHIDTWINPDKLTNTSNLRITASRINADRLYADSTIVSNGVISGNTISANSFIEISPNDYSGYIFSSLYNTSGLLHANVGSQTAIIITSNGLPSLTTYSNGYNTVNGYTQFFQNVYVTGNNVTFPNNTTLGLLPNFTPLNAKLTYVDNINNYTQFLLQNKNSGSNASGDVVVTADNGTDYTHYIDFGINSSTFTGGGGLDGPNDGYLLVEGGKLVIMTIDQPNDIVFAIGGDSPSNEVGRWKAANGFVVNGNISLNGNLNFGGHQKIFTYNNVEGQNYIEMTANSKNDINGFYVAEGSSSQASVYTAGPIYLISNTSGSPTQWEFDTTGNLYFPDGSIQSTAYSNAAVASFLNTNALISFQNVATSGNLTVGGNLIVVGNITTAHYETISLTEYANNIIASGNITAAGNISAAYFTGNAYYLTGLPATYGNTQVSAYYVANTVATGNIQILSSGNIRLPTGGTINESAGSGTITLTPNTAASALAGVAIGGSGYLLAANNTRNAVLNYGSINGQMGIYQLNVYGNQQNAIINGGAANNYGNIGGISSFFGNLFVSNVYSPNYNYPNGVSILSGIGGNYGNTQVSAYLANGLKAGNISISPTSWIDFVNADTNWRMGYGINSYSKTTTLTSIDIVVGQGSVGPDGFTIGQTGGQSIFELSGYTRNAYFSNGITAVGTANVGNVITTNGIFWSNGVAYSSGGGGSNYGNSNVASYLPTYSGNSNAAFFTGNGYYLTGISVGSTYSNSNVAAYLPTYNGNIGNIITGNLIPKANASYYLGNNTLYWANVYANNFLAATQIATPKLQFTVGGAQILEDNPLDLAIIGTYQISVKPNGTQQYTFASDGSFSGPGGTIAWANGAIGGNVIATGVYWSNGVAFSSGGGGSYGNTQVAAYLPTYAGNVNASFYLGNGYYLTGVGGGSTYSNTNVAAYLTTYSGNLSAGNIAITSGASGNISGTGYVVAGNMVANTNMYANGFYWYNNNATLASTITGTFSNSNVASYLPTYTGNISVGNINLTVGNANIVAGNSTNMTVRTVGVYNVLTISGIAGGYNSPPYTNQSLTGGNGSGMTASYSSVGGYVTQASLVVTNPGTGYKNGDVLTLPGGLGSTVILTNYNPNVLSTKVYNWTFSQYDGNITVPGNIIMPSNSAILGDFTNSTFGYRTVFQTINANATTGVYALPNGTSTGASWQAINNSNANNASKIMITTNGTTDVQLVSGVNGSGTYLPLSFYNNGAAQMVIYPNGNVYMSNANPITTTGNINVGNLLATGNVIASNINVTSNLTYGNVSTSGNVTAGYLITTGSGGNITGANYVIASNFITTGSYGNITGANVITANTFIGTSATISGNLYSPSQTGKSAAIVAQNTAVTMDNIKVQWLNNGSSNANQLQIGSVSGTPSILYTYVFEAGTGGTPSGGSSSTSLSTTYANIGNPSGTAGDLYMVTATVGTNAYRVSAITGSGYSNNLISIERLV